MPGKRLVRNVAFAEDGVSIDYIELPADIRENGLTLTHQIFIPEGDDYDDEIDAIRTAALDAVGDALDDFTKLPAVALETTVARAVEEVERLRDEEDDDE